MFDWFDLEITIAATFLITTKIAYPAGVLRGYRSGYEDGERDTLLLHGLDDDE